MTEKRVGLIAGYGQFPLLFSKAAHRHGWHVYAVGYQKETDPDLAQYVDSLEWLYLGQIKKMIKYFHKHQVTEAVMLGGITKTKMFTNVRPDTKAIALMARMRHTHDDAVLRAFADLLEKEGIRILPSTFLLPELLAPPGCWTKRKPSQSELSDLRLGWKIAKEIGRLDIGQCIVVAGGTVLAVEAIEGTDACITRGGALGKGEGVIVKVCKPTQDMRFDIPAIGLQTLETMKKAGIKTLAVEAGKAVVFDRQDMIEKADLLGISISAFSDEQMN